MSKIICDICGTSYPDTAECCPICGCSRDTSAALLGDDLLMEELTEEPKAKGGRFSSSKRKKEIFDYDEVNAPFEEGQLPEEENPYEEEEPYEEEPRHNTVAVVLLTTLIVVLLAAAVFLFVRYYLPNMGFGGNRTAAAETTTAQTAAVTQESTEPTIPCTGLTLTSGTAELTKEGQYFLLHVLVTPTDTTDQLTFTSADESIATVTEDGRITAVAEGETVILITCGDIQYSCPVTCRFEEETVPTTQATVPETTGAENEASAETVGEVAGSGDSSSGGLQSDVTLKLKKTDIRLGVYYEFTLELDCDLEQNEVEWSSEHPYIATVDENGTVKALKSGTTSITAKYGDQEVSCIVRCG